MQDLREDGKSTKAHTGAKTREAPSTPSSSVLGKAGRSPTLVGGVSCTLCLTPFLLYLSDLELLLFRTAKKDENHDKD